MNRCGIHTSVRTAVLPTLDCVRGLLADVWVCTRALELTSTQEDAAGHDADVGGCEGSAAKEQRDEEGGEGKHFSFFFDWKRVLFLLLQRRWELATSRVLNDRMGMGRLRRIEKGFYVSSRGLRIVSK